MTKRRATARQPGRQLLAQWLMSNNMRLSIGQAFTFTQEPTRWWDCRRPLRNAEI